LKKEFAAVTARLAAAPVAQINGQRGAQIQKAIGAAEPALEAAQTALQAPLNEDAAQSQHEAISALAAARNAFKSHDWAAKVGLFSILLILLWQAFAPQRLKVIPGPLIAVTTATALAWMLSLPVLYVEVPDSLAQCLTLPSLNVLDEVPLTTLFMAGLTLAVVASAETLLCATAVDRMHNGPPTQYDRELAAQGIGNMLCGLLGALPMTGVIVRSAANVQAGAQSRLSAILHGLWLLLFVAALGFLLRQVPIAALAGVLVYTGFRLIDFKGFQTLYQRSRVEGGIFLATATLIVVQDLLTGVVVGMVLSALKLLLTFSQLNLRLTVEETAGSPVQARLAMTGAATFLRLPQLASKLDEVPPGAELHVDLEQLDYVDHACLELLINWERRHAASGGRLVIDWGQLHARFKDLDRPAPPATNQEQPETKSSDHTRSTAA
jgi:MFS superfamily sulfate permease-like transporter